LSLPAEILWWANFVLCGSLCYFSIKHAKRKANRLVRLVSNAWPWQFIASIVLLMIGWSPWHLIWTAPVIYLIAFLVDWGSLRKQASLKSRIPDSVLEMLAPSDREHFVEFVRLHSDLQTKVSGFKSNDPVQLGILLISYSDNCLLERRYFDALQSLQHAIRVDKTNPLTWASLAEVHFAMNDRCAIRWAEKLLSWNSEEAIHPYDRIFTSFEGASSLIEIRYRMNGIIKECRSHSEWRDSSTGMEPEGI
jgi:hypothetical protein